MTWREDAAVDTASQRIPRRFLLQARELAQTGALGRDVNPFELQPVSPTESARPPLPSSELHRFLTEPNHPLRRELEYQAQQPEGDRLFLQEVYSAPPSDRANRQPLEP